MIGDDKKEMSRLNKLLAHEFEIKDLGKLQYFIGIEVARSKRGIFISQRKYILDLLKETGMTGCKLAESPIESNHKLQSGVRESVDKKRYQRLLSFTFWKCLLFSKHDHLQIEAFTDADWAGSLDDRRSTSGYCTLVGGNLITWRSKKQSVVARSSAEAEYRAIAQDVCELLWLQKLLQELRLYEKGKLSLYCESVTIKLPSVELIILSSMIEQSM
ncbi:PREDICTED: uncharacterized protein LOC109222629 [Nicotiana attenuata]|uniref:uncharacterized protein LOC109222629 n=1 Tax=Nicotiana attenuata TaxID=49451 RepID=UPI0009058FE1|nr:PREDICTED: uncharacterized protein LOC109222629 [Nicotiana attenuata]